MKRIYLKWAILVIANTVFSLVLAADFLKSPQTMLGAFLGILSFILLYVKLEKSLINSAREKWRKALIISAGVVALLLLFPGFPMISGALALELSGGILGLNGSGNEHISFFSIYLTTIIDGLLLSSIVAVLAFFIRLMLKVGFSPDNSESNKS